MNDKVCMVCKKSISLHSIIDTSTCFDKMSCFTENMRSLIIEGKN